jgi:hypothetical protein
MMAISETVMDHFKRIFSKDNLKRILVIGGPVGVVAGILFSFGFANPELALTALVSLEGSALYDLLKESFTRKKYDEEIFSELCQKIQENKNLQADVSKYLEGRWDDFISIIKDSNEEYKHLLYRNIHNSTYILQNFKISLERLNSICTELKIKNFDIYFENEDPKESFENVMGVEDTDIVERPEVSKIIKHFQEEDGMLVLEGYPTSGKSFVAYLVAREWLKEGGRVAVLRAGEVLPEGDYALLRQESFLAIADQNNELTDMAFRNMENSAKKCLITRRLGEFARPSGILESRLTEKFVSDEDYLYSPEVVHGNIRCFLGEFGKIKEYIEICERKFGIKAEAKTYGEVVKQLSSLAVIEREDKRNSTAIGLIYSIFVAAKEKNFDTLSLENVKNIIGEKPGLKSIFENIYINSWNEKQKKLARVMKLLNDLSGDYIFNKFVVEKAYEAYYGNLEGYELALETLLKVRAIDCNGHIAFWHPLQLDVVDVYLSKPAKTSIIKSLISKLGNSLHNTDELERIELLLSLVKISFSIDPPTSIDFVRALRKENERFGSLGITFAVSKVVDEFFVNFDLKCVREFFELVNTDDSADETLRIDILSFICSSIIRESREEKARLLNDIVILASEELRGDKLTIFYYLFVNDMTQSGLPGEEKERWIEKIKTMAKETLEKGKEQITFYFLCVSNIVKSGILEKEKERWIEKIETMAKETLGKGRNRVIFYSLCFSAIAQSGLPGEEKERWIEKIETMAKETLEKESEQASFYSDCVLLIAQSGLPGEEKERWIEKIETMAKETLEKGKEQITFCLLCVSNVAKSGLPWKEKEKWILRYFHLASHSCIFE